MPTPFEIGMDDIERAFRPADLDSEDDATDVDPYQLINERRLRLEDAESLRFLRSL